MKNNFQNYYQAVEYLESLFNLPQDDYFIKKTGRKIFLQRLKYLLKLLGNPQLGFKYIHIGGTSGKGSVATMIHSVLTEAGYNAGLFTSPFCTTSIEKIKVGNLLISPNDFVKIVERLKPAVDLCYQKSPWGHPSYFEIFTAIAFLYFKQKKCDYVVLEVGLGGRFDATNVIPPPKITVINLIDFDHTDVLGKTLKQIAKEKAAIIKPKTIFFTTKQSNSVLKILKTTCQKNRAEFNLISDFSQSYKLGLLGKHQQKNAALVVAVCQKLDIKKDKILTGLKKAQLPCRLEIIQRKPLVILDGAHNLSKLKTTADFIKNLTYRKLYLIIALTNERNPKEIFGQIESLADHIFFTRYQARVKKCYPPKLLAKKLKSKKPNEIFLDAKMALAKAKKLAKSNDLILITGSLYLAGELRNNWRSEKKILQQRTT
ncbi:MAG: folylpolyglutamate synthase/dihydrofolate synthase family protein [Patescibacteria group bacterium]